MSDLDIIQAGRHRGRCFGHEFAFSSNKGTPQVGLGFRMSEGDVDENRVITAFRYFTDNSYEYSVADLRTCGWTGDDLATITLEDLQNEVELVIVHEEYEGKVRAKVAYINPIGGGMIKSEKAMTPDELRKFATSMRTKVRAVGGAGQTKPKPAGPQNTAPAGGTVKHLTRPAEVKHPNAPGGGSDWDQAPPAFTGPGDDVPFAACGLGFEPSAIASVLRRRI